MIFCVRCYCPCHAPVEVLNCAFMDTVVSLRHQMAQQSAERGEAALELEAQGKTWAQIGDKFGVSRQRAGQILEAARKRRKQAKRKVSNGR